MKGTVFNIQRFSVHDGPGIRTTVFLKGCPLRCQWCHNPEGLETKPQLLFYAQNCTGCYACIAACKNGCHHFDAVMHVFDREACTACMDCAKNCVYEALQVCGKEMTADEVVDAVLRDKAYYETSGGGVTLSGGEPLMQPAFSGEILEKLGRENIHRTVETSGFAAQDDAERVLKHADLVLLDWKHSDAALLKQYTGARLEVIEQTLSLLGRLDKPVVLRCPLIPGVNDMKTHFDAIAQLVQRYGHIVRVEIMPYHTFGKEKYPRLYGREGSVFRTAEKAEIDGWQRELASRINRVDVRIG